MRAQLTKILLTSFLLTGAIVNADEICVCPALQGCTINTLQAALVQAEAPGQDSILLQNDAYTGNFVYDGTGGGALTIAGGYSGSTPGNPCPNRPGGAADTVLDGIGTGTTFMATNMDGEFIELQMLTITRGSSVTLGAGLTVLGNDNLVSLVDLIVSANTTSSSGPVDLETAGGIYVKDAASVSVSQTTVRDNTGGGAGGLRVVSPDGTQTNVYLAGNSFEGNIADAVAGNAGAVSINATGSMTLQWNYFGSSDTTTGNQGGAAGGVNIVPVMPSETPIGIGVYENQFEFNTAGEGGTGGVYLEISSNPNGGVAVRDNVFFENSGTSGGGLTIVNYNTVNGSVVIRNTFESNTACRFL